MTVHMDGIDVKLHRLLLVVLSSDSDGEIAAAISAMRRIMQKHRIDIHTFAAPLLGPPSAVESAQPEHGEEEQCKWQQAAWRCLAEAKPSLLTRGERAFLRNVMRYQREPSEKQKQWLHDLVARVRSFAR
ncbi:hypothetical protein HQ945_00980 [Phyllobacterium sp. BT25]|uniref:DUF2786 domain-containing protein n=1 Tax=Phyllobacterium pellucidum TaxID=2740464 RepID=A0A849VHZ5_9HYPH|nr:hypothetical protein [Phyllobacterium pellucidum]NTS29815.1 hypothetical protein [Phyllobacterium pellucidum]